jgi:hypothetical protein
MRTLTVTAYYDRVLLDCKWLLPFAERLDSQNRSPFLVSQIQSHIPLVEER